MVRIFLSCRWIWVAISFAPYLMTLAAVAATAAVFSSKTFYEIAYTATPSKAFTLARFVWIVYLLVFDNPLTGGSYCYCSPARPVSKSNISTTQL